MFDLEKRASVFFQRAFAKYGSRYDYSLASYKNNRTAILIKCNTCNVTFQQRPDNHLNKPNGGCKECQRSSQRDRHLVNFDEFVKRAKQRHGNAFEYHQQSYNCMSDTVSITCSTCSHKFEQTGVLHVTRGAGCPRCHGRWIYEHEEFVRRAREIHGDLYEYITMYEASRKKIHIRCLSCDVTWSVIPHNHINNRSGCPRCYRKSFVSKQEKMWLDALNIPISSRTKWIKTKTKNYLVDAFYGGTIYEFYGSYWHGDPRIVKHEDICLQSKRTFKELYDATLLRQEILTKEFEVKFVWEFDWKKGRLFSNAHPL